MGTLEDMGTRRRDYGSGSIFQRSSDGLWVARIDVGWDADGKRRRRQVTAKTEAEVKRRLRDLKAQLETDNSDTNLNPRATVKQWVEQWLTITESDLRPASWRSNAGAVRNWIIPTIGHRRLTELTPGDVRAVQNAQRVAGRTSSTMLRTHSVTVSMLKAAIVEGHRVPPRVLGVKAPAKSVNDRDAMTVEDALAILPVAGELHHGSRFLVALMQGMRQAECLGLTWDCVDLERGTVEISWQLQPLPYRVKRDRASGFRVPDGYDARQLYGAMHLVRPKSRKGYRVIPLVEPVVAALRLWREAQSTLIPENPHNLVWPNVNGTPTKTKTDDVEWYALQCTAGVGHPAGRYFTIHEARHTTATLLMECEVDNATIVAILGHSDVLTTRGYQHVRTERAREALGALAERLRLN